MQKVDTLIEDNSSLLEDKISPLGTNPIYSESKLLNLLSNYVKDQSLQQEDKKRS